MTVFDLSGFCGHRLKDGSLYASCATKPPEDARQSKHQLALDSRFSVIVVSSSPMAISLASALPGPLPRAPQKPPKRPNRRLPRKQSAAKLPMRPRKNDRLLASRVA